MVDRTGAAARSTADGEPSSADVTDGETVLVVAEGSPAPARRCLRPLAAVGRTADTALVVTTTEGADATLTAYEETCKPSAGPALGLVDSVSEQQSISALYEATPVVYTPAQGDLERLVLALSELAGNRPPATGERHLVVRSLTPILDASSVEAVAAVLERITGLRTADGLCLIGIDETAHDESTVATLSEQVDDVRRL